MGNLENQINLFGELINTAIEKALEEDNKELAYKYRYLHELVMKCISVAMLLKTFQLSMKSIMSVDLSNLGDD